MTFSHSFYFSRSHDRRELAFSCSQKKKKVYVKVVVVVVASRLG
jgi:hypothetical protein